MYSAPTPHADHKARRLLLTLGFGVAMTLPAPALATTETDTTSPCCEADLTVTFLNVLVIPETPTTGDCNDICSSVPINDDEFEVHCDSTAPGGTFSLSGAKMVTVYDHPGDGSSRLLCPKVGGGYGNYCSFGDDAYGDPYYCQWDTEDAEGRKLVAVSVNGGPATDVLQFWWTAASEHYDLDAYRSANLAGKAFGFGEDDEIIGSRSTNTFYHDILLGGYDSDSICGLAGNDLANGDHGDDQVCGDLGLDNLIGGADDDTVCGLDGNGDVLEGATGNDLLSHGDDGSSESNDGGPHVVQDTCDASYSSNCENYWTSDPCDAL